MNRRIRLLAAVIALAACDQSATATGDPRLQGTWHADEHYSSTVTGGPRDAYGQLTFGADGSYRHEYLNFGAYGRAATELTSFTRVDGQYRLVGGQLEIRVLHEAGQDVQYPETNYTHLGDGQWQSFGSVEISGDRLAHHYISYALDAPEPTVQTYTRVNE